MHIKKKKTERVPKYTQREVSPYRPLSSTWEGSLGTRWSLCSSGGPPRAGLCRGSEWGRAQSPAPPFPDPQPELLSVLLSCSAHCAGGCVVFPCWWSPSMFWDGVSAVPGPRTLFFSWPSGVLLHVGTPSYCLSPSLVELSFRPLFHYKQGYYKYSL